MKNWKTTLWGTLAGVPQIIIQLGLATNPKIVAIGNLISAIGVIGGFASAKDSNVTGGTVQQ
jgi:hypothetical protein